MNLAAVLISSVIVDNLDIFGSAVYPTKAESKLTVDADAVLSGTVASERLQAVSWRNPQVLKRHRDFELPQFASCHGLKGTELPNTTTIGKCLGLFALE